MTTQTLYLAYLADTPALEDLDIKHQETRSFLDEDFTFTVIGSSHYIGAPDLDFHELLSCKPINNDLVKTIPLDVGYSHTVTYETDDLSVQTVIEGRPLAAFPDPDTFDIAYRFGPDAYTTIDCPDDNTYETYHTYPEHNLALFTRNTFETDPVTAASQDSAREDGHSARHSPENISVSTTSVPTSQLTNPSNQ